LTTFIEIANSMPWRAKRNVRAGTQSCRSVKRPCDAKVRKLMHLFSMVAVLAILPDMASSQSQALAGGSTIPAASTTAAQPDLTYVTPTEKTKLSNYAFDAFGPFPIVGAASAAGINQISNAPPEWGQGAAGYGKRFGSDYGIALVGTTTRYGLAEAFREDTLYYRCECIGFLPRLRHAIVSTVTGRRGADGHVVFSVPAVVGPYAGTMTAVYGWYPNRFGAKDAFRMGNYSLLAYAGQNISLEFFYSGSNSLISRMHLRDTHGATDPGPNH
jgi:hypothetical protein